MSAHKIEVEIVALTNSIRGSQSYAIVLGEVNGVRQMPIIIGQYEAQSIAVSLENMKNARPLTHDLMKNTMDTYGISLREVVIYKLKEGVFYAKLVTNSEMGNEEIDSRTSDALALAVRYDAPIYTYENIFTEAGISDKSKEAQGDIAAALENEPEKTPESPLSDMGPEQLQEMLEEAIVNEDYNKAAQIRDELNKREEN